MEEGRGEEEDRGASLEEGTVEAGGEEEEGREEEEGKEEVEGWLTPFSPRSPCACIEDRLQESGEWIYFLFSVEDVKNLWK